MSNTAQKTNDFDDLDFMDVFELEGVKRESATAKHFLVDQNTEDWMDLRLGKITSSKISNLLINSRTKGEVFGKGALTYIDQVLAELLTGKQKEFSNEYTDWGKSQEINAIMAYQEKIGNAVTKGGFFKHSDYVGGSPDGLVGPQGGIEIKCLSSANHLGLLRCKSQEALKANYLDHYAQCQFNMYLSDSIWWDFIAFDPRYIDAKKRLHVIGMVLDTDFVAELLDRSGIAIRLMAKLAEDFYK